MSVQPVKFLFCPQCGKPLSKTIIGGQLRENCLHCSFIHWGEFALGVGGVLWRENTVLLVQRANNPGKGIWTIPGGYVDQGEQISKAVKREILEETGLISEPQTLIALWDWPGDKHNAYIAFLMCELGGTLQAEPSEVSDLGFFSLEQCNQMNVASLSMSIIQASLNNRPGLIQIKGIKLIGKLSTLYQVD
ncbi:MAG: NUDIX domain-containing protein [Desulfitobacteriaceae bacterium]